MEFFSKDTLFNNLPQIVKQKIVNIRNLSLQHRNPLYIPETDANISDCGGFEHIFVPSSKKLYDTFLKMAKVIQKLESYDVTNNLRAEALEFIEFVKNYKMEINNTDFIAELEKTIGMMESKFEHLKNEF